MRTIYYVVMDGGDGGGSVDFFYDKIIADYHEDTHECEILESVSTLLIPDGTNSPDIYTASDYFEEFEVSEEDCERLVNEILESN